MSDITASPALDVSLLPSTSSSDLVVVPSTFQEFEQTWLLNAAEWIGPLNQAQYLERERFLINQDLTRDNGMTSWILTSPKLPLYPDGSRPILAACEIIRKPAYLAINGEIQNIHAHGVGSVFTRPEYRGRGYAGRMMTEVGKELEELESGKSAISILFSDVGKRFYAKYGWTAFPSTHIQLAPLDVEQFQSAKLRLPAVQDLTREGVREVPMMEYLEEALKDTSRKHPDHPCVALQPDMLNFDWHHAREQIYSKFLGLPFPQIKGAIDPNTGLALVWCRVYTSNPRDWSLYILHIAVPPALRKTLTEEARYALAALLLRAQHEAYAWNMAAGVKVWDPSDLTISAAQALRTEEQGKVQIIDRDRDHICSLRLLGAGTDHQAAKDVVWINLERYIWC